MPWFYNSRTGAYAEEAGVLGFFSSLQSHFGLGWHVYGTYKQMTDAIAENHWPPLNNNPANPVGKTIVGSGESILGQAGLGSLTSRQLWIRIAEGVLGIALILVAVAELGKGTAVGAAVKKIPFI